MRFVSLFLIFNIVLCYSGICSAPVFEAIGAEAVVSHCDVANHDASDSSAEPQVLIQNSSAADCDNSQCCYETLTNSSIEDNSTYKALVVLYLIDFPSYLDLNNSKNIDLTATRSSHDPTDIYLSVSSFLL